jgi:hypothetical protein
MKVNVQHVVSCARVHFLSYAVNGTYFQLHIAVFCKKMSIFLSNVNFEQTEGAFFILFWIKFKF